MRCLVLLPRPKAPTWTRPDQKSPASHFGYWGGRRCWWSWPAQNPYSAMPGADMCPWLVETNPTILQHQHINGVVWYRRLSMLSSSAELPWWPPSAAVEEPWCDARNSQAGGIVTKHIVRVESDLGMAFETQPCWGIPVKNTHNNQ